MLTAAMAVASPMNVALSTNGGVATQSSNYNPGFGPELAIDGNTDGLRYGHGASIQHTGFELNAWWKVMFDNTYALDGVVIWNRLDCCQDRINPFSVMLLDAGGNVISTVAAGQTFATDQASWTKSLGGVHAAGLEVQLDGRNYLHMAQVQVLGGPIVNGVPEPATLGLVAGACVLIAAARCRFQSR